MANLCAPVTVVTAMDRQRPHGTTVSAVMSLSLEPMLVAVALANTSDCCHLIQRTKRFGVNVLATGQHEVALQLARKGPEKFDGVRWTVSDGLPQLERTAVWVACDAVDVVDAGDHRLIVGRVSAVGTDSDAGPLTYHRRRFGTHVRDDRI
ncbi:flavin reductase family protein [Nocardia sp. NPDC052254]|uniref:flavin reductase family protein n=1 Tax=Nocardia sp. NPDC052254 TaxID=3155681 RepID=UPI00343D31B2